VDQDLQEAPYFLKRKMQSNILLDNMQKTQLSMFKMNNAAAGLCTFEAGVSWTAIWRRGTITTLLTGRPRRT